MSKPEQIQERWIQELTGFNSYWFHDGNRDRPYARLTGGKISNFFANCTPLTSRPWLLEEVVHDLLSLAPTDMRSQLKAVCGSAYGGITLTYEMARQTRTIAWYTEKGEGKEMKLGRFGFDSHHSVAVMVEDVITEFTTTGNSIKALQKNRDEAGVGTILPYVFAIVNRSGQTVFDGFTIISLITEDRARNWKDGENPFTPDGKELVPPIRPKGNWETLTRHYD